MAEIDTKSTEVHRITVMVVDHDQLGAEQAGAAIEAAHYPNDCVSPKVVSTETRSVDWHDDHPLNGRSTCRAALSALFGDAPETTRVAEIRLVAKALYLKLLATAGKLARHEPTDTLEADLARAHAELEKLGVL